MKLFFCLMLIAANFEEAVGPKGKAMQAGKRAKEAKPDTATTEKPRPGILDVCCVRGLLDLDLSTGQGPVQVPSNGYVWGQTDRKGSNSQFKGKSKCFHSARIKVNFQRLAKDGSCDECVQGPRCGRRMLKVELDLETNYNPPTKNWLFNIGDSITNDGFGGDANTQTRDAEMYALGSNVVFENSDDCSSRTDPLPIPNAVVGAGKMVIYVSNYFVRVVTNTGIDEWRCSSCLFALNGQKDGGPKGVVNEDIYIALNSVVSGRPDRIGFGICRARISWVCPWGGC